MSNSPYKTPKKYHQASFTTEIDWKFTEIVLFLYSCPLSKYSILEIRYTKGYPIFDIGWISKMFNWNYPPIISGHRTRNTIDFVLVKQCMMERIVDSCVRREVKMSDHNLLCCTVHVNMFVPSPSHSESPESCGSKSENNQSRTKKVLS